VFARNKQVQEHEIRLATLALAVAELRNTLAQSSPAALRNRIDELVADIDQLKAAHRKEMGRLWKRFGLEGGGRANDGVPTDDEYAALLELQRNFGAKN
jgi:hypothetical protein